ncbi:MAG: cobalt-precorrin 5A hydrolase [Proteobacteria bacterium]|nr:cobalt-precorrin 5A hydrolase [Pseudomonadota bacterium]
MGESENIKSASAIKKSAMRVNILPVTERGAALGRTIGALFTEAEVCTPKTLKAGGLKKKVKSLWKSTDAIIFIGATGIAVRMIAPHLKSKATDPAVLVADETGNFVISLVSGHLGGANELAKRVAAATGARPVITTATDSHGLPCIEEIAGRGGLVIENVKKIKVVNSAILSGGPVVIVDKSPERRRAMREFVATFGPKADGIFTFVAIVAPKDAVRAYVVVTSEADVEVLQPLRRSTMLLRPKEYVAGIGCRRGVSAEEVRRAIRKAMKSAGLSPLTLNRIATIDIKRDEEGLAEFARSAGVEIEFFSAEELNSVKGVFEASPMVLKVTGAKAVAEPAAIISARAELCQEKIKTKRVTVALAKAPFTL